MKALPPIPTGVDLEEITNGRCKHLHCHLQKPLLEDKTQIFAVDCLKVGLCCFPAKLEALLERLMVNGLVLI